MLLAEYKNFQLMVENDFYYYGSKSQINSCWGVPVNQCGTKEEVKSHLNAVIEIENAFRKKCPQYAEINSISGFDEIEMCNLFLNVLK